MSEEDLEEHSEYEKAVEQAYEQLFMYIRNDLLPHPDVIPLRDLTSKLEDSLKSLGIAQIKPSTKKNNCRKLENEFTGSLHFVCEENGKVLVYPDSLTIGALVKKVHQLKQDLKAARAIIEEDTIVKAAMELRRSISTQDEPQTWPPDTEKSSIPENVTAFLRTMLTDEKKCVNPSPRVQRLVTSFGSDLIFAVSTGKTKPPKHVLLPFTIKSLTGNKELKHIMSRLGHSVSYSQLQEIDTAFCLQKLELAKENTLLPNAHPHVLTTVA
ncbi:hypothetical protein ABVT39_023259 [Epinephelus coioides]